MTVRVAIIGSGPAGMYAAGALLARAGVEVDVFDRLPTPWGLVRAGVAPDHPKIKSVTRVFERLAADPRLRFFGNIEFGGSISRADLRRHYDAVIYAVGAQADRRLGIPGEELPGSWPASAFIAWYNGHPDHGAHAFDLTSERAVVVGNGNVAADVTRMLALTRDELGATDTAQHAIDALAASRVCEIVVLGRRGPAEAAFTNPELLELGELRAAGVAVDWPRDGRDGAPPDSATTRRNVEIVEEYALRVPTPKPKRIVLRFLAAPVEITGAGRVEAIRFGRTRLVRDASGQQRVELTGDIEELTCGLVIRAIGYRGVALPGVPFDAARGAIAHVDGRVAPGEYVTGWIKRGPSGVIGTNKKCAQETVAGLFADLDRGGLAAPEAPGADCVPALLRERGSRVVAWAGWQSIDHVELEAGAAIGRPRGKLATWDELLGAAEAAA